MSTPDLWITLLGLLVMATGTIRYIANEWARWRQDRAPTPEETIA